MKNMSKEDKTAIRRLNRSERLYKFYEFVKKLIIIAAGKHKDKSKKVTIKLPCASDVKSILKAELKRQRKQNKRK